MFFLSFFLVEWGRESGAQVSSPDPARCSNTPLSRGAMSSLRRMLCFYTVSLAQTRIQCEACRAKTKLSSVSGDLLHKSKCNKNPSASSAKLYYNDQAREASSVFCIFFFFFSSSSSSSSKSKLTKEHCIFLSANC